MSRILDVDDFAAYGLMMGVFDNVVNNSTDDSNTIYNAESPGDDVPGISTVNSLYPFGFTLTTDLAYVEWTWGFDGYDWYATKFAEDALLGTAQAPGFFDEDNSSFLIANDDEAITKNDIDIADYESLSKLYSWLVTAAGNDAETSDRQAIYLQDPYTTPPNTSTNSYVFFPNGDYGVNYSNSYVATYYGNQIYDSATSCDEDSDISDDNYCQTSSDHPDIDDPSDGDGGWMYPYVGDQDVYEPAVIYKEYNTDAADITFMGYEDGEPTFETPELANPVTLVTTYNPNTRLNDAGLLNTSEICMSYIAGENISATISGTYDATTTSTTTSGVTKTETDGSSIGFDTSVYLGYTTKTYIEGYSFSVGAGYEGAWNYATETTTTTDVSTSTSTKTTDSINASVTIDVNDFGDVSTRFFIDNDDSVLSELASVHDLYFDNVLESGDSLKAALYASSSTTQNYNFNGDAMIQGFIGGLEMYSGYETESGNSDSFETTYSYTLYDNLGRLSDINDAYDFEDVVMGAYSSRWNDFTGSQPYYVDEDYPDSIITPLSVNLSSSFAFDPYLKVLINPLGCGGSIGDKLEDLGSDLASKVTADSFTDLFQNVIGQRVLSKLQDLVPDQSGVLIDFLSERDRRLDLSETELSESRSKGVSRLARTIEEERNLGLGFTLDTSNLSSLGSDESIFVRSSGEGDVFDFGGIEQSVVAVLSGSNEVANTGSGDDVIVSTEFESSIDTGLGDDHAVITGEGNYVTTGQGSDQVTFVNTTGTSFVDLSESTKLPSRDVIRFEGSHDGLAAVVTGFDLARDRVSCDSERCKFSWVENSNKSILQMSKEGQVLGLLEIDDSINNFENALELVLRDNDQRGKLIRSSLKAVRKENTSTLLDTVVDDVINFSKILSRRKSPLNSLNTSSISDEEVLSSSKRGARALNDVIASYVDGKSESSFYPDWLNSIPSTYSGLSDFPLAQNFISFVENLQANF